MSTLVCVTGVGNVGFAATFLRSYVETAQTWDDRPIYIEDGASGCDFTPLERIFTLGFRFARHSGQGGCNALWTECVTLAEANRYDVVVVANDDIIFPACGWLQSIERIFERNPHVGAIGIGADGAWCEAHRAKERWFTDPSLLVEAAEHCESFRDRPVKYVHHVSGPLWACRPRLWLQAGGIPKECFWGWGEIIPCIELRKIGYQSVACQWPCTILHFSGGAERDIHSDPRRHESFNRRAREMGDESKYVIEKYGTGHAHLMAQEFDEKLPGMRLPPLIYDAK